MKLYRKFDLSIMLQYIYKTLFIIALTSTSLSIYGQADSLPIENTIESCAPLSEQAWVDSVFNSLSTEERIAQLIMIRAHSDKSAEYHEEIANVIKQQKVGGLCFFQGGPIRQIDLVNYYQKISETPLLVAIDGEWGVGMRLDSAITFPRQMTLGAIQNDSLIFRMGIEVAKQCKAVGVDLNFAPVADVNNNSANPVINSRSFGENPLLVAQKASMYMKGMQSQQLLTCAKHFPGHGDTDSDSHKTLPTVHADKNDLDSIHLFPFKIMIDEGISSVMVAHLSVPALDNTPNRATTLSPEIVNGILKTQLNFKGLAITDALEMRGVSDYFEPGELEVMALLAGNDILLMPNNAETSIQAIKSAFTDGQLDSNEIYNRVKKVLKYKYIAGLNQRTALDPNKAIAILNSKESQALNKLLYRNALTLLKNQDSILPLTTDLNKSLAVVSVGVTTRNTFASTVSKYRKAINYSIPRSASQAQVQELAAKLEKYDYVILGILNTNNSTERNYGIYQSTYDLANLIGQKSKLIIDMHANPYAAHRFFESANVSAFLISYQDNDAAKEVAAEAIFGGYEISGKLPVSINDTLQEGFGIQLKKKRLSFGLPEEIGIPSDRLYKIDSIIEKGISERAYPGCQVLIAKDGFVFYQKNFGHQTYGNSAAISDTSIYDLASITKVMATTLAIMKLSEEGKIDIDRHLQYYLPELQNTNKGNILIRDLLSHQARLTPWIPFYKHTMIGNQLDTLIYKKQAEPGYSTLVCDSLYILDSYRDSVLQKITESELLPKQKYRYSDLGMYYMRKIIEQQSGLSIQKYLMENFYIPLGLEYIGYLPMERFDKEQIVPTENDNYFRNTKIQGTVHDQGCAMVGGIEGHAGLFSNSVNIAIICQMLLENGQYANQQYLKPSILEDFTRQQFPLNNNRRGLGFDKPLPNHQEGGPTCNLVSSKSFGHSGFTGTYFWTDPVYQITYIFLSNRTFPTAENRLLITNNTRTEIQKEIYQVFGIKH